MSKDIYNNSFAIVAYITLSRDRAQNGNPLILVASSVEEQVKLCEEISKALNAEVVQLTCGDYMIINRI